MKRSVNSLPAPELAPRQDYRELRAAFLRALRSWVEAQHLPQRLIAAELQIPRSAVSDIKRGESRFTAEKLAQLWVAAGGSWQLKLSRAPAPAASAVDHSPSQ